MENKEIENNKSERIEKVIIKNEDGTTEEIKQALVVDYSLEGEKVGVSMRFHNLNIEDLNNIFRGFQKIIKTSRKG